MSERTARRRNRRWLLGLVALVCLGAGYLYTNLHVMIVWPNGGVPHVYTFWLPDVDDADERPVIVRKR